ncbi:MAG: hypothetical protein Q4F00_01650 [bacterium]|nr:hypothetical protein [bacterium]
MSVSLYHILNWKCTALAKRSLAAAGVAGMVLTAPAARLEAHPSSPPAAEAVLAADASPLLAPASIRPTAQELAASGITYNEASLKQICEYSYPLPKLLLYRLGAEGAYARSADEKLYWTWHIYIDHPLCKDELNKALKSFSPERAAWLRSCIKNARAQHARPFAGIMGYDGWYEECGMMPPQPGADYSEPNGGAKAINPGSGEPPKISDHYIRRYYAIVNGQEKIIGESFNFVIDDHAIDLDGDGSKELVCSCTYGGSGTQRVYIFRRNGSEIERGQLDYDKLGLTGWSHWGNMASANYYDAKRGAFIVEYPGPSYPKDPQRLIRKASYADFSWESFEPTQN